MNEIKTLKEIFEESKKEAFNDLHKKANKLEQVEARILYENAKIQDFFILVAVIFMRRHMEMGIKNLKKGV